VTARDLIGRSLRLLGVLASGESLPADQASDGLDTLNDLLDAWRAERLTLFAQARTVTALTVGVASYTIGSGGTINVNRPLWIDGATIVVSGEEIPIRVYTRDEWRRIAQKTLSGQPEGIFYNPTFPLGTVEVYPVPAESTSLVIYGPAEALVSVASLDTAISMPPGWSKALRYALAVDLAPEYPAVSSDAAQLILSQAVELKATIKRPNEAIEDMDIDPALRRRGAWFDINTGDFR
jgi:hypothetical protein